MKINTTEEQGERAIKNLIKLTGSKKEIKQKYKIIEEEILRGIFGE